MQRIPFNEAAQLALPARAQVPVCAPVRARARALDHAQSLMTAAAALGCAWLLCFSAPVPAQQLEQSMRHPWTLYVFVSTGMPHQALVNLAREAGQAHASMVLRGFPGSFFDLGAGQRFVAQLNEECCGVSPASAGQDAAAGRAGAAAAPEVPGWSIDPALYRRFDVSVVPTFVLAETGGTGEQTFTKVSGDMALASALKYVAQGSASPARRAAAASIYQSAYRGRQ